jgi:hypothetical protein
MYDEARHESLIEKDWDENRARDAIELIVRGTHAHFDPRNLWPAHPLDQPGADRAKPLKMLYFGAAGVIWALNYLHRVGATAVLHDYSNCLVELASKNRADLNLREPQSFSYLMGDVGIELVQWRSNPSKELADAIFRAVESNTTNPAREFMWGAPGTMLAALFMLEYTRDDRWKELFVQNVRQISSELVKVTELGCYTWTQDLYGQTSLYLGAVHGFAANIFAIMKGRELVDPEVIHLMASLAVDTAERAAKVEDDYANWPPELGGRKYLVQHCHGAPGMINCLAELPTGLSPEFDHLLVKGGELTWRAGPSSKGSNLCHGTSGNGYAFLKLYRRTGNKVWLERARAFAMHAIGQCERHAQKYAQLRYSLWTGDLGLAVFLWGCIQGEAHFPTLDVF